eukprot:2276641-Amphidinium_carterae.2
MLCRRRRAARLMLFRLTSTAITTHQPERAASLCTSGDICQPRSCMSKIVQVCPPQRPVGHCTQHARD